MKFRGRGGMFRKSIHLEKNAFFSVKKAQLGGAVSTLAIQFIWLHFVKPQTCAITCRACWHQEVRTAVQVIPSPLEEHTVTKTAPPPSQQRTILNTESDAYVRSNPWPCYQVIIDLAHIWSPAGQLSDSYEPATDYTHRANITRWWIICKRSHTAPIKIQMSLGTNRKSRHSVPVS